MGRVGFGLYTMARYVEGSTMELDCVILLYLSVAVSSLTSYSDNGMASAI